MSRKESISSAKKSGALSGIDESLPVIETWPNQFPGYEITITWPEFTSVCPLTGLPDHGQIVIRYRPRRKCLELKSLKFYFLAYRNLGIFYENAVNRIMRDIISAAEPHSISVVGEFRPRGGMLSKVEAKYEADTGGCAEIRPPSS